MRKYHRELATIFFGDEPPLPDPLLVMILEFANLAKVGHKIMTYTIFFPSIKKNTKNVEVDGPRYENVPKK